MTRNVVFCADGTWNQSGAADAKGAPTNVWKVFSALAGEARQKSDSEFFKETTEQIALYVDGIGTTRSKLLNYFQGAVGAGVSSKITDGYLHLSRHYRPDDRVFLFGFSRGAYVVRALAGMISNQGLLKLSGTDWKDESHAEIAVSKFLERKTALGESTYKRNEKNFKELAEGSDSFGMKWLSKPLRWLQRQFQSKPDSIERPCPVTMVGVWDTVGALGVPVGLLDRVSEKMFEFSDLHLSPNVMHGFHAVAIDEYREAFQPTLWNARDRVEQVWFCGAHADVGGGYAAAGLSDYALRWMMGKARNCGLHFDRIPPFTTDCLQKPTDSYSKAFGDRCRRLVPKGSLLHESVAEKLRRDSAYRPEALADIPAGGELMAAYQIVPDRG